MTPQNEERRKNIWFFYELVLLSCIYVTTVIIVVGNYSLKLQSLAIASQLYLIRMIIRDLTKKNQLSN
jgi:hypothetical protein